MFKHLHPRPTLGRRLRHWLSAVLLLGSAGAAQAQNLIYGLGTVSQPVPVGNPFFAAGAAVGDQGIVAYDIGSGRPTATPTKITGVAPGQVLVGMDFRLATGQLYALGYNPALSVGNAQLYILNVATGAAVAVNNTPITLALGTDPVRIGFDFNPRADRIRVVAPNRANYRLNPNDGAIAATDGQLTYAATDPNAATVPGVGSAAYTDSYLGATTTTLYDIDELNNGILAIQNPPNNGTLNTQGTVTLDGISTAPFLALDLDISHNTGTDVAYLSVVSPRNASGRSSSDLYIVNLSSGLASSKVNLVPAGTTFIFGVSFTTPFDVRDIAAPTTPPACNAPTSLVVSSLTGTSATVSFTGETSATGFTVTTSPATAPQTLPASATSVSFSGLLPATTYTVSIISNCAGGATATSPAGTVSFTTTSGCDAPTSLAATAVTSNSASLSFSPSATATNYTLTVTPAGGPAATQTVTGSPVSLSGLTPATAYNVSLVSNCAGGLTSAAATTNFTTLAAPAPAPTLAVTQGGTSYPSAGTAYAFGNQTVGTTSAPVAFTLTNGGPDALTISGISTTGDYALSGAAPTTVAAGGTATVSATFAPTAAGTRAGPRVITSNATTAAPYTVNLTGTGVAAPLPDLVVSTTQLVSGSYNNVTVTPTGVATLSGPLAVAGALLVQTGGVLQQNCQLLNGAGSFTLQAGAGLVVCDPAGITATGATGAIQVAGIRSYSPGAAYIYNGTAAQLTGAGLPAQVGGLGVANPFGLTLSQAVAVSQQVTLQVGNLNTNGQQLTLLSSAAGTAFVVNTGGVVNGTATVQRYIDNANPVGYRHYAAPVSNTTLADLATAGFAPTFNPAYNTSPTPGTVTPFPTVFGYDQARVATVTSTYSSFDKGWFSPLAADAMLPTRGYTVNAPNTALVDFVGTLNNGPQPSGPLARGTGSEEGWHLLGNPYPAPLDWSTVAPAQRPGMDAAMYVFQSSGQYGGSYRTFANGVGGSSLIPAASGYFARVTTPGTLGAVNLTNANRVTTPVATPAFGRGTADNRPQLHLQLRGATGLDEAYLYFEAGATAGLDARYDAVKLANPSGFQLASAAAGQHLAINGLPVPGATALVVPLAVAVPQAGSYAIGAAEVANFGSGTVTLLDALTGTRTVLTAGASYAFVLSGPAAPGRFAVEFRSSGALATTAANALAAQTQLFPNPASASFRVVLPVLRGKAPVAATLTNALGQTVLSRSLSAPAGQAITAEFDVRGLARGVYTLRLTLDGEQVVRKVVVE